jgi:hypothetical protein
MKRIVVVLVLVVALVAGPVVVQDHYLPSF